MTWDLPGSLELALRLGRGLDLAATLQIFGALLFTLLVARDLGTPDGDLQRAWTVRLLRFALALKLIALAVWLPAQAVSMTEALSLDAVWLVAAHTQFGQAVILRTVLLVVAAGLAVRCLGPARRPSPAPGSPLPALWSANLLAGGAVALQSLLGHSAAADDRLLVWLVSLHVLAAGAWLGGLLPLWHWLRTSSASTSQGPAQRAVSRFSWLGLAAVITLVLTAWWQAEGLIGDLGGWLGTPYGWLALLKTLGFGLLLGVAALNRLVFTPRLQRGDARALRLSIAWEAALGLLVIGLAVALASLQPAVHLQPQWPLPWQPDPDAWDKPWIGTEIERAAVIALIAVLGLASLVGRRTRLLFPVALVAIYLLPLPNWRDFVQPAHPGSFYRSETGYTAASIVRGQALTLQHCTQACANPQDNPADLDAYNIWQRSDGDLFDWLTRVFDTIGHSPFAHGTLASLDARQRWQLIDYFRARVSGNSVSRTQRWPYAVPPPALSIACKDETALDLRQLRGRFVYLLAVSPTVSGWRPPVVPDHPVVVVTLGDPGEPAAADGRAADCQATGADAWQAMAIAGGRDPAALAGTGFVIDPQGWLRLQVLPDDAKPDAADWARELQSMATTPQPGRAPSAHAH